MKGTIMSRRNRTVRKYGIINFAFDFLLTCLTGGFWLVWVFVREMRNRG